MLQYSHFVKVLPLVDLHTGLEMFIDWMKGNLDGE